MSDKRTLSLWEKISYGLGLTALNLVLTIVSTYLLYFYTDIAGLAASSIGFMFLVSRLIGCFAYAGIGAVIDKTSSRWGKSRPYFLWLAAPLALLTILTVLTPHFPGAGNLIYAYLTYNLLIIVLSVANLTLGAIVPSMTANFGERAELGAIGGAFGIGAILAVSYATLPLARILGGANQATGFRLATTLYALLAFVLLLVTFWSTRERIRPLRPEAVPIRLQLSSIQCNHPWQQLMLVLAAFWIVVIMHTQTTVYYLKYNAHRPDLIPLVMATLAAALPGSLCTAVASKKLGKRNTMLAGCVLIGLGLLVIACGRAASVALLLGGNLIFSFGKGIVIALFIAMLPDIVDYGEWRTTVRAPGMIYGGSAVALNIGMGIGGALSAWLLSMSNYAPNSIQTTTSLRAIGWSYLWAPMIAVVVMIGVLAFYRLDARFQGIKVELDRLRSGQQP